MGHGVSASGVSSPSLRGPARSDGDNSESNSPGCLGSSSSSRRNKEHVQWTPKSRWKLSLGKKEIRISQSHGGRVGLRNMGNSCFMNAGLQCLSHIEPIIAYFLTGKYKEEMNMGNPFGTKGRLVEAFARLQEVLWQENSKTQSPKQLHRAMSDFAPYLFEGHEQQDAQEFVAMLLDGLHEDLNLIKERARSNETNKKDELEEALEMIRLEQENGEEYMAAMAWFHHLLAHKSFFVDIFQGQLRSQLTCIGCGLTSKKYDPFLHMSLPVESEMTTLEEALRQFLMEETLSGSEQWGCPRCKRRVNAKKKIDIWKLPPVLVVHLKRFEYNQRTQRFRKIQADLRAPLTMDLTEFVTTPQREPLVYDVICVANHHGPFGYGHYTATCRHPVDGRFYHFNDDNVQDLVDDRDVLSSKSYVLFLMRQPASEADDDMVPRQSATNPSVWPHIVSKTNSQVLPDIRNFLAKTGQRLSSSNIRSSRQAATPGR